MATNHHIALDVSGYIKGSDKDLKRLFRFPDGGYMTADEARAYLKVQLQRGIKCMPIGKPCEGFDYSGGGCPGHSEEAADA